MRSEFLTRASTVFGVPELTPSKGIDVSGTFGDRLALNTETAGMIPEETLVRDDRSDLSPAQVVESKLSKMLKESSLPVSQLQMRVLLRGR